MNKIILVFAFCLSTIICFGQNCPDEPTKEKYKKVMSSAYTGEYEYCSVTITAVYFQKGYLKGKKKPRLLNDKYFFQCVAEREKGTTQQFQKISYGDFFVMNKKMARQIKKLKKGDKLELTGRTTKESFLFKTGNTFFVVEEIKKVE